jgi:CRP-like cAMP-binding protein
VRARLAISRAYLDIAGKERDAALQLVADNGLQAQFAQALEQLDDRFGGAQSRASQIASALRVAAGDLLDAQRRQSLAALLVHDGSVNKSGYAQVCAVAPATASKHLALLTERGLLVQGGKGPSTRYTWPTRVN